MIGNGDDDPIDVVIVLVPVVVDHKHAQDSGQNHVFFSPPFSQFNSLSRSFSLPRKKK